MFLDQRALYQKVKYYNESNNSNCINIFNNCKYFNYSRQIKEKKIKKINKDSIRNNNAKIAKEFNLPQDPFNDIDDVT